MMLETFKRIKEDGDGEDRDPIQAPSDEEIMKAFKEYDKDGNGTVEKEEMKAIIRK